MAMNKAYLKEENIAKIQEMFLQNKDVPSVVLHSFLDKKFYEELQKEIRVFALERHPIEHCYEKAAAGEKLKAFLGSQEFLMFVSKILGRDVTGVNAHIQAFGHKNYTILHDKHIEEPGIDLFIGLTDKWNNAWGGNVVYVDGSGEYTKTQIGGNMLVIVERKKTEQGTTQKFMQYVNHHAKEKLVFVSGTVK
jgi:hypothetical protein